MIVLKRILFTVSCVLLTSILSCQSKKVKVASAQKPPNIIFFYTDDQSYDTQKDYGNPNAITPNLDKLASQGVVFERNYSTTAICMASRANVMTGLYEYKTGCNFDRGPLGTKQWSTSFPVLLRKKGYRVGFAGKFGFSISDENKGLNKEGEVAQHDFDFWGGSPGQTFYQTEKNKSMAKYAAEYPHSTRAYGAATIDFINKSVQEDKPFCMSVFFKAPHRPFEPDPMFDSVYKNTIFRKLPNFGKKAGEHLAPQSRMGRQYNRFEEWGYDKEDTYQESLRLYNQLIYGVDYSIGMVLNELKKLNIDDNTVIIFSSDNGYFSGSHGLGSKELPYEEGARIPLIIVDPRNKLTGKMRKTISLSSNIDVAATILDLANIKIPTVYDGRSLLPIINNAKSSVRVSLPIIQVWGEIETHCLTVMEQNYKYIYWFYREDKNNLQPTEELFNIKEDPYEMQNLAKDTKHISELAKMRKLYDQQLAHWKSDGVNYNGYGDYVTLLDRSVDWKQKEILLKKKVN